jgi:uncharacterized membrane protein YphA (DoxX/SURF4 family)
VIALLALRLATGWHFFKEGSKKFSKEGFTSLPFLQAAKGPLADFYKAQIPDRYGLERLNLQQTSRFWKEYKDQVAARQSFDQDQTQQADRIVDRYVRRMTNYLAENREAIGEYRLEVERLQVARREKTRVIPFQRERIAAKESELRAKVATWLGDIQSFERSLQDELNSLVRSPQRAPGVVVIADRGQPTVDPIVKWVVFGSGILLLLGLFTRVAAAAAMVFLLSVMASQPPWVADADLTYFYYQTVEVAALLVLIVFAAGQFAGLDYVIYGMRQRCCPRKASP